MSFFEVVGESLCVLILILIFSFLFIFWDFLRMGGERLFFCFVIIFDVEGRGCISLILGKFVDFFFDGWLGVNIGGKGIGEFILMLFLNFILFLIILIKLLFFLFNEFVFKIFMIGELWIIW